MILLLAILVGAATTLYISAPFWWHRMAALPLTAAAKAPETDRAALLERRDTLLRDLKDLEFDLEMGKIEPDDYAQLRATTATAAAQVLERLEAVTRTTGGSRKRRKGNANSTTEPAPRIPSTLELETEIEILIARARQQLTPPSKAAHSASANGHVKASGWQCVACGRAMPDADRFCGSCGQPRPV